jgi:hypothetical protein
MLYRGPPHLVVAALMPAQSTLWHAMDVFTPHGSDVGAQASASWSLEEGRLVLSVRISTAPQREPTKSASLMPLDRIVPLETSVAASGLSLELGV